MPTPRRALTLIRRGHLYLGLFLLPWSILYGVTAFLFNHPSVFADRTTVSIGRAELAGTPLEVMPTPDELAAAVVAKLNETSTTQYRLAGSARYNREFAFAAVSTESQTLSLLFDAHTGTGTVRAAPNPPRVESPPAPFATKLAPAVSAPKPAGVRLDDPLPARIKIAIPTILSRAGFPAEGDIVITSVPDLLFPIETDGATWDATYNGVSGVLTGVPASDAPPPAISTRTFLLRLHTAHGYPAEANGKWFWAVIVDAMAVALCAWGVTGLVMWWQIRVTRRAGGVVLLVSAACAVASVWAMS